MHDAQEKTILMQKNVGGMIDVSGNRHTKAAR
jgi:hypothetical protein